MLSHAWTPRHAKSQLMIASPLLFLCCFHLCRNALVISKFIGVGYRNCLTTFLKFSNFRISFYCKPNLHCQITNSLISFISGKSHGSGLIPETSGTIYSSDHRVFFIPNTIPFTWVVKSNPSYSAASVSLQLGQIIPRVFRTRSIDNQQNETGGAEDVILAFQTDRSL